MEYSSRLCFGVDIIKTGSKLSDFVFSVAVVRGDEIVKVDRVSMSRLIRMLWEMKPEVLAVDNVLELGGSLRNLLKFLSMIPPGVRLVQVNLSDKDLKDLRSAARLAGIELPYGKLDPELTALTVATLAIKGVGREVNVFSKKVKIYVFRGRSGRAGGSSADRLRRNIRATVAQAVKKIEDILRSNSIEYDLHVRRSKGGVDSAVFTVYCDRERLYGLIKNLKGHDVVIRIKPIVRTAPLRRLIQREQSLNLRYLIVGLDPGVEVGVAVLNLDGQPILVRSEKGLDRDDIISLLSNIGKAVIVATDKQQPPELVQKIAAALGARLYTPNRDLKVHEKEALVSDYAKLHGIEIKSAHVRDALAAALMAFKTVESKFEELEEKISEMGFDERLLELDKYRVKLIEDHPVAAVLEEVIAEALSFAESKLTEAAHEARALIEANESMKRRIRELERSVESLEAEKRRLESKVRALEEELSRLRAVLDLELSSISKSIMRDRKVYELTQRLANAVKSLDSLRCEYEAVKEKYDRLTSLLPEIARGRLTVVRKVPSLSRLLDAASEIEGGEVVFVNNISLEDLVRAGPEIRKLGISLILPENFPDEHLEKVINEVMIPAVKGPDYSPLDEVAVVNLETVSKVKDVARRVEELRRLRERSQRGLTLEDVENIIREYRRLREREDSGAPPTLGREPS